MLNTIFYLHLALTAVTFLLLLTKELTHPIGIAIALLAVVLFIVGLTYETKKEELYEESNPCNL
jgi:nitrate reductase gamma subunit